MIFDFDEAVWVPRLRGAGETLPFTRLPLVESSQELIDHARCLIRREIGAPYKSTDGSADVWELSDGVFDLVVYERRCFLEVFSLVVPDAFRRKGVASAILLDLEREAARRGLLGTRVRAVVSEDFVNMLLKRGYIASDLLMFEKRRFPERVIV